MKTLFKIDFENDTYELKGNNFGKEVLLRNNETILTKRNFGTGNKFEIGCPQKGVLILEYKVIMTSATCEVRIFKEDTMLAQYDQSLDHLTPKWLKEKPEQELTKVNPPSKKRKLLYSIGSITLAIIIWGLIYSWTVAPLLVAVVLLHELGHLGAMAVLGYKDKNIIFAPPFGALAIGKKDNENSWQKIIVCLSGPLPGIILGFGLLYLSSYTIFPDILVEIIFMLLIINYINLLPISPLDGGNVVELIFLHKHPKIQLILAGIGAALLAILGTMTNDIILLITVALFGLILLFRIKDKDNYQVEITLAKKWVHWTAGIIYVGLWAIALYIYSSLILAGKNKTI